MKKIFCVVKMTLCFHDVVNSFFSHPNWNILGKFFGTGKDIQLTTAINTSSNQYLPSHTQHIPPAAPQEKWGRTTNGRKESGIWDRIRTEWESDKKIKIEGRSDINTVGSALLFLCNTLVLNISRVTYRHETLHANTVFAYPRSDDHTHNQRVITLSLSQSEHSIGTL